MKKIDDILNGLQGQQPDVSNPDEWTDSMMAGLPDLPAEQPKPARRIRLYIASSIAVAASVLLLLTLHYSEGPTSEYVAADSREGVPAPRKALADSREGVPTPGKALAGSREEVPTPGKALADLREGVPTPLLTDPNLHRASYKQTEEAGYMAPSRVDDFIASLAEYNHIESEPLNCHARNDSTVRSQAYVFPDDDEIRLFDRLLQVACRYGCDSPGYQLTITQQQLMFSLEDQREDLRYLWLAERISGDRIILYTTRSPMDRTISSDCYQNFREKIAHTNQTTEL